MFGSSHLVLSLARPRQFLAVTAMAYTQQLVDSLVGLPVAQAAYGALVGAAGTSLTAKQTSSVVSAATRGAASAAGVASGEGDGDSIYYLQGLLGKFADVLPEKPDVSASKKWLREHGAHDLAARVGRLSKARNWQAHPDIRLGTDLDNKIGEVITEDKLGAKHHQRLLSPLVAAEQVDLVAELEAKLAAAEEQKKQMDLAIGISEQKGERMADLEAMLTAAQKLIQQQSLIISDFEHEMEAPQADNEHEFSQAHSEDNESKKIAAISPKGHDNKHTSTNAAKKLKQVKAQIHKIMSSDTPPHGQAAVELDRLLELEQSLQAFG